MTRRELLKAGAFSMAAINLGISTRKELRFAVIADIHHGLAPDSLDRLRAFAAEIKRHSDLDFVLQMGDFCHPYPPSEYSPFLKVWNSIQLPKHHVLGNHDMDRGSKADAMKLWGMPSRYGSFVYGDWRFLVLDLNHFKKGGKLFDYERGNYFTDDATYNWADPEQLEWLQKELAEVRPTILLSHQPLGFRDLPTSPGIEGVYPPEQVQIMEMVKGKIALSMFGHLHVDRLETFANIPFLCVNSASYFWQQGMHPYTNALFAFCRIDRHGLMTVEGRAGDFSQGKPETTAVGCSASIDNRSVRLDL